MYATFVILIILISIISSAWEYRKLVLSLRSSYSDNLLKFLCENALIDYIRRMDNDAFREFCMTFFKPKGYPMESEYENILILKGWEKDAYIKYINMDSNKNVEAIEAMELYGAMCSDNIKNGIIITTSQFDDKAKAFCRKVNIDTIDINEITYEIRQLKEENVEDLLPGLNS